MEQFGAGVKPIRTVSVMERVKRRVLKYQAKGVYDYIATAIEAGDGYSMALILGGSIYAWGHNYAYQLGDGTQQSKNIPAPLAPFKVALTINLEWKRFHAATA